MIRKILFTLKMFFILGRNNQTFLDAKWIKVLLKNTPKKYKKAVALNILSLSPHYFYPSESNKENFLLKEYKRNLSSRRLIFEHLISDYVTPNTVVMDYGCGPSFLARIVAEKAKKVYAIDISDGVLLCADAINHRDNIQFLNVFKNETDAIEDNSVDLIYSFAVLQHVSQDLMDGIFALFSKKLKPNGKLLLQVQLEADGWKSEQDWKEDTSLSGKLKYKYGLHAFSNSVNFYHDKMTNRGLTFISVADLSSMLPFDFDDICHQQLIIGQKEPAVSPVELETALSSFPITSSQSN
jgi:SAM-dependent methyltransferase